MHLSRSPSYNIACVTSDADPEESKCPSDVFNLLTGFPRSLTDQKADTSIIHERLRDVLAAGNEAVYEYMLNYEAHMMQKPTELPMVTIVMKGEQGCRRMVRLISCRC